MTVFHDASVPSAQIWRTENQNVAGYCVHIPSYHQPAISKYLRSTVFMKKQIRHFKVITFFFLFEADFNIDNCMSRTGLLSFHQVQKSNQ